MKIYWSKARGKQIGKPIGWWIHKFICEAGYNIHANIDNEQISAMGLGVYYRHLNIMCRRFKINLYGEKI